MSSPRRCTVRLSYARTGTQPPVFLAGSFSSPPWEVMEMSFAEASVNDAGEDGQYRFYKDVDVPEGRWQYKFRIGHGDWWVLDEQAETGTSIDTSPCRYKR